jgi:hypothetical protein
MDRGRVVWGDRLGPVFAALLLFFAAVHAARADRDAAAEDGSCKIEETGEVPVAIQSDPPGAILRIRSEGKTVARGRTPFARLLPPGRYELIVDAARGEPQRRVFEARKGEAFALVVRFPK